MDGFVYDVFGPEGKLRLRGRGITHGYGNAALPHVLKLGKRHIMGRIESCKDWGSRGSTATNPAQWFLWEVEWKTESSFKVTKVISRCEPGRRWKQAKRELSRRFDQLE